MQYKILMDRTKSELTHLVQIHIDEGWVLQGGVCVTEVNTPPFSGSGGVASYTLGNMWTQAVVKP